MLQDKSRSSAFRLSLLSAAIIGLPLAVSSQAVAQEQTDPAADASLEKIQVVGSRRVGRTVNDSPVPIDMTTCVLHSCVVWLLTTLWF